MITDSPGGAQAQQPPAGAARGLAAAAIEAVRTRLDLAAVELEIHLLLLVRLLAWILGAVVCALLALAFGLTALVLSLWDSHRMLGLLGGTGLFFALAAIFGLVGARTFRSRPNVLDGTLQQLDHDQRSARGVP